MAIFEVLNNQQSYFNRYFRRNVGDDDYATIPEVTLAGDFVIEFDVLMPSGLSGNQVLMGDSHSTNYYLNTTSNDGFSVWVSGVEHSFLYPAGIRDGKLHRLRYTFTEATIRLEIDGNIAGTRALASYYSGAVNFRVYSSNSVTGSNLSGILANLKIYDNGTLVRDYPINDNSNTIRDLANGQDGTIINPNADDWGLFDKQSNGDWKGNGLSVPPWDSVDQVLVTA